MVVVADIILSVGRLAVIIWGERHLTDPGAAL
jgi:hypothetical protein